MRGALCKSLRVFALILAMAGITGFQLARGETPALAIIDTGVCPSQVTQKNAPLAGAFISEKLTKSQDKPGIGAPFSRDVRDPGLPLTDEYGHGTHLSGILWRELQALDAEMPPSLVMLKAGKRRMAAAHLLAALERVEELHEGGLRVDVLLCAFNLYPEDCEDGEFEAFEKAIVALMDCGIWVVASAGNRAADLDEVNRNQRSLPACISHQNLVVIAAAAEKGLLANRSDYGAERVWLAARGSRVDSLWRQGGRKTLSGTSQAAALAAARLFALRRKEPALSLDEAKKRLEKTCRLHPSLLQTTQSGRFLDATKPAAEDGK